MSEQTDTPETDTEEYHTEDVKFHDYGYVVSADFARQLERERNALRAESENWKRRHGNALELFHQSEEERRALRAEVEKLKADKARLEYILTGVAMTRAEIDKIMKENK